MSIASRKRTVSLQLIAYLQYSAVAATDEARAMIQVIGKFAPNGLYPIQKNSVVANGGYSLIALVLWPLKKLCTFSAMRSYT